MNLRIAGYNIGIVAEAGQKKLAIPEKFLRCEVKDPNPEIVIRVRNGFEELPVNAVRIFYSPFIVEADGVPVVKSPDFWSIWRHQENYYIRTSFPVSGSQKTGILRFSLTERKWDMWIEAPDDAINPLEYPMDSLILYYLTVINMDIMIHASGVAYRDSGFLFSGISGKGKSTIAHIWEENGATVIHDDRLVIRKADEGYRMFNTPVYENDVPKECRLGSIFLIDHGPEVKLVRLLNSAAVSRVMANCIQHAWGNIPLSRLLGSVTALCGEIPVSALTFSPDSSVVEKILESNG